MRHFADDGERRLPQQRARRRVDSGLAALEKDHAAEGLVALDGVEDLADRRAAQQCGRRLAFGGERAARRLRRRRRRRAVARDQRVAEALEEVLHLDLLRDRDDVVTVQRDDRLGVDLERARVGELRRAARRHRHAGDLDVLAEDRRLLTHALQDALLDRRVREQLHDPRLVARLDQPRVLLGLRAVLGLGDEDAVVHALRDRLQARHVGDDRRAVVAVVAGLADRRQRAPLVHRADLGVEVDRARVEERRRVEVDRQLGRRHRLREEGELVGRRVPPHAAVHALTAACGRGTSARRCPTAGCLQRSRRRSP